MRAYRTKNAENESRSNFCDTREKRPKMGGREMKKRGIISCILLMVSTSMTPTPAPAQEVMAKGFIGGMNLSTFGGADVKIDDTLPSATGGYAVGAYLVYDFTYGMGLRVELVYSQKGAVYKLQEGKTSFRFNYLEIPSLFQVTLRTEEPIQPIFMLGPALSFTLNTKEKMESGDEPVEQEVEDIATTDLGLILGTGLFLYSRFEISVRYNWGIWRFFTERDIDRRHQAIEIRIALSL